MKPLVVHSEEEFALIGKIVTNFTRVELLLLVIYTGSSTKSDKTPIQLDNETGYIPFSALCAKAIDSIENNDLIATEVKKGIISTIESAGTISKERNFLCHSHFMLNEDGSMASNVKLSTKKGMSEEVREINISYVTKLFSDVINLMEALTIHVVKLGYLTVIKDL